MRTEDSPPEMWKWTWAPSTPARKNITTTITVFVIWFYGEDEICSLAKSSAVDRDPDEDSGFWWPKIGKIYYWKKLYGFVDKNCNLLIPRPPLRTSKLQEKPSALKREHPALQKTKFINFLFLFLRLFLPSWIRIRIRIQILNPDPDPGIPVISRFHNTASFYA